MAFGVKWNRPRASAVGLRGARTNRPRPRPRPRALPADLLRGWRGGTARRSLQPPRPRPPPLHCRQAGKGEEGGGPEPSAIFPASPKHTRTHSARLTHGHGHTLAGRRPRAPPRLARVRAVSGTGRSPPTPAASGPQGRSAYAHTPPRAVLPNPPASPRPRAPPGSVLTKHNPRVSHEAGQAEAGDEMQKLDPRTGPNLGASQAGGWRGTKIWEAADGGRDSGVRRVPTNQGSGSHPGRPRVAVTTAAASLSAGRSPLPPSPLGLGR